MESDAIVGRGPFLMRDNDRIVRIPPDDSLYIINNNYDNCYII